MMISFHGMFLMVKKGLRCPSSRKNDFTHVIKFRRMAGGKIPNGNNRRTAAAAANIKSCLKQNTCTLSIPLFFLRQIFNVFVWC